MVTPTHTKERSSPTSASSSSEPAAPESSSTTVSPTLREESSPRAAQTDGVVSRERITSHPPEEPVAECSEGSASSSTSASDTANLSSQPMDPMIQNEEVQEPARVSKNSVRPYRGKAEWRAFKQRQQRREIRRQNRRNTPSSSNAKESDSSSSSDSDSDDSLKFERKPADPEVSMVQIAKTQEPVIVSENTARPSHGAVGSRAFRERQIRREIRRNAPSTSTAKLSDSFSSSDPDSDSEDLQMDEGRLAISPESSSSASAESIRSSHPTDPMIQSAEAQEPVRVSRNSVRPFRGKTERRAFKQRQQRRDIRRQSRRNAPSSSKAKGSDSSSSDSDSDDSPTMDVNDDSKKNEGDTSAGDTSAESATKTESLVGSHPDSPGSSDSPSSTSSESSSTSSPTPPPVPDIDLEQLRINAIALTRFTLPDGNVFADPSGRVLLTQDEKYLFEGVKDRIAYKLVMNPKYKVPIVKVLLKACQEFLNQALINADTQYSAERRAAFDQGYRGYNFIQDLIIRHWTQNADIYSEIENEIRRRRLDHIGGNDEV